MARRTARGWGRGVAGAIALGILACAGGCGDVRPPMPAPTVQQDSPIAAAQSLLRVLKSQLEAQRSARPSAELVSAFGQLIDARGSLSFIRRTLASDSAETPESRLLRQWSAMIAFYADGIRLEAATAGTTRFDATVRLPVEGDGHPATIVVTVRRGNDGPWRVTSLRLRPESAAETMPSPRDRANSQPSSAPQSAPPP